MIGSNEMKESWLLCDLTFFSRSTRLEAAFWTRGKVEENRFDKGFHVGLHGERDVQHVTQTLDAGREVNRGF